MVTTVTYKIGYSGYLHLKRTIKMEQSLLDLVNIAIQSFNLNNTDDTIHALNMLKSMIEKLQEPIDNSVLASMSLDQKLEVLKIASDLTYSHQAGHHQYIQSVSEIEHSDVLKFKEFVVNNTTDEQKKLYLSLSDNNERIQLLEPIMLDATDEVDLCKFDFLLKYKEVGLEYAIFQAVNKA
jgi:hypothetical protein